MLKHLAVLTGGGDCPGLNAVMRALVLTLAERGVQRFTGIRNGFAGLMAEQADTLPLRPESLRHLLLEGGTILGSSNRDNPLRDEATRQRVLKHLQTLGVDCLVILGGDGTLGIGAELSEHGLSVLGIPKTIDNDVPGCERSFGFDTAVSVVADALQRLRTTARSHGRVLILETMGRHAGWIALEGGLAGDADLILLPEQPATTAAIHAALQKVLKRQGHAVLCMAEGFSPEQGKAGAGSSETLRTQLAALGLTECRTTVLGHLQRGGAPSSFDRVLSTRYGHAAARALLEGHREHYVTLQQGQIVVRPLRELVGQGPRLVHAAEPLLLTAHDLGLLPEGRARA